MLDTRTMRDVCLCLMAWLAPAALMATSSVVHAAEEKAPRLFQVEDIFGIESIGRYFGGPYSFSSDGKFLAFTRARVAGEAGSQSHKLAELWGNASSDVWVQSGTEAPVNLTHGVEDGSGWWAPEWSPDGRYLAMLSTRGGNVRLWVWDVEGRSLRALSEQAVDLAAIPPRPYLWLDSTRLIVPVLPEGEWPLGMGVDFLTPEIATREWPKVIDGKRTTASVLESGVPVRLKERPQGRLLLIEMQAGRESVVFHGATSSWQRSPRGGVVAFTEQVDVALPKQGEPLPAGRRGRHAVRMMSLAGQPVPLRGSSANDALPDSLRWSPDGAMLAFLGYREDEAGAAPSLYRVDVASGTVQEHSLGNLDATAYVLEREQLEWCDGGGWLLRAAVREPGGRADARLRRDWWLIGPDGSRRNLTAGLDRVPDELWPEADRKRFVGVSAGAIWRLDLEGGIENLTDGLAQPVARLDWPTHGNSGAGQWPRSGRTYDELVFSVRDRSLPVSYRIDLADGRIAALRPPAPNAEVMAYDPAGGSAVFQRSDREGLFLWRSEVPGGKTVPLVVANTFLSRIRAGSLRRIDYTSLDGQPLKAWLVLPPDYEEGQRYPLLTYVYPGLVMGAAAPALLADIASGSSLNLQIPASRGYAVVVPSMPLGPVGAADDPMLRLGEGVLPAVDRLVGMGIADPRRLYLMGHSFGGYATYGLVTQTQRFAAAVSLAGLSNLISLYGQFDSRWRYSDYPQEYPFQMMLMESAYLRMGGPPWEAFNRYLRNSPVFHADRVETPLMIVQGDLDFVPIQQGEEFFNALYRQGKRARFVRYWGEGHVVQSRANVRDMWQRIFEWFEQFPERCGRDLPVEAGQDRAGPGCPAGALPGELP